MIHTNTSQCQFSKKRQVQTDQSIYQRTAIHLFKKTDEAPHSQPTGGSASFSPQFSELATMTTSKMTGQRCNKNLGNPIQAASPFQFSQMVGMVPLQRAAASKEEEEADKRVEKGWANLCFYSPEKANEVGKEVFAQYVKETGNTIHGHASQAKAKTKESGKKKADAKPNQQTKDDLAAFTEWNTQKKEKAKEKRKKGRKKGQDDEDSE